MKQVQRVLSAAIVFGACALSNGFGAESKTIEIQSLDSVSSVSIPKGCTAETKGFFGGKRKKQVDCFGIVLRGIVGVDRLNNKIDIKAALLMPAETQLAAQSIADDIIDGVKNNATAGKTITLSNLRYLDRPVSLSVFTKDVIDTQEVVMAGITVLVHEVTVNSNYTQELKHLRSIGIN